ncbi:Ig-specific serine endopeptidase MIP [Ureaplasma canigenitalium]|uniref:Ig-specific serine endopeptidase MIP n=1 Tax=Ureaplasma canigenitalium TaxID=42092 RepID=UPI0004E19CB6|nr:DUF31 family protein [Ureaplasma canigenitalium]
MTKKTKKTLRLFSILGGSLVAISLFSSAVVACVNKGKEEKDGKQKKPGESGPEKKEPTPPKQPGENGESHTPPNNNGQDASKDRKKKEDALVKVLQDLMISVTPDTSKLSNKDISKVFLSEINGFKKDDFKVNIEGKDKDKVRVLDVKYEPEYTNVVIQNGKIEGFQNPDAPIVPINVVTGKGVVSVTFSFSDDKDQNPVTVIKKASLNGFKKNNLGIDHTGVVLDPQTYSIRSGYDDYNKLENNNERFYRDNDKLVRFLVNELASNPNFADTPKGDENFGLLSKYRNDATFTKEQIEKFDETAAGLDIPKFHSAGFRDLAIPSYKDGQFEGISYPKTNAISQGQQYPTNNYLPKMPSYLDLYNRRIDLASGVPRILPNETYREIALQTYSVSYGHILNPIGQDGKPAGETVGSTVGTMWILDFEQTDNQTYPTKWFFATNVHVAEHITKNLAGFSMTTIKPTAPVKTDFGFAQSDEHFDTKVFNFIPNIDHNSLSGTDEEKAKQLQDKTLAEVKKVNQDAVKVIYEGKSFLKNNPKDYLTPTLKEQFKDGDVFADFAVVMVDFEKLVSESKDPEVMKLKAIDLAKEITHDYATKTDKHIKFIHNSYLKDYDKVDTKAHRREIDRPANYFNNKDQIFLLGYPNALSDRFPYIGKTEKGNLSENEYNAKLNAEASQQTSLWVNQNPAYFFENFIDKESKKKFKEIDSGYNFDLSDQIYNQGNILSKNISYLTFTNKPGVSDIFLAAPFAQDRNTGRLTAYIDKNNKQYLSYGLTYILRDYSPKGGSSGSSMRNQNNELIGIYNRSDEQTKTGLATAFRSEGFDYKNLYGNYNLAQYDLIYGNGKDQKEGSSYREALKNLYNGQPGKKTNLFKNGFEVDNIPNEFKFDDTKKAS